MEPSIALCLSGPTEVPPRETVADWWPRWKDGAARAATPVAMAVLGGFDADRVGWAFAAGYQAALRAMVAPLPAQAIAAFCVTEEGGNRPRDIHTRIEPLAAGGWSVSGAKRWTTLGPDSSLLFVVGALPPRDEGVRPRLGVVRVPADSAGVQLLPMPPTRFVPEVPHARVQLDAVQVAADALLPGDGYEAYVKPFRTIEDTHVTLAVLAYLLREARARGWPTGFAERLVAAAAALQSVAAAAPDDPAAHVALAGALQIAHGLYAEAGRLWSMQPEDAAARRWQRDSALFTVAGTAREARAARAWERLRANR